MGHVTSASHASALAETDDGWTAADMLSSARYWAFLLASTCSATGTATFMVLLPRISDIGELRPLELMGLLGASQASAAPLMAAGITLAIAITGRGMRASLLMLALLSSIGTTALILTSLLTYAPVTTVLLYGVSTGTLRTALLVLTALIVLSGRPHKVDFALALFPLLVVPLLISQTLGPSAISRLADWHPGTAPVFICVCFWLTLLCLLVTPTLTFDARPRLRHAPLPQPHPLRSPLHVALLGLMCLVSLAALMMVSSLVDDGYLKMSLGVAAGMVILALATLAGIIYIFYWFYRIHGELAGAHASPRLLTPVAAVLIALLMPLGLPLLLLMLWSELNQRLQRLGQPPVRAWVAMWTCLLPPIAMGMLQAAANKTVALQGKEV
jgi:MFS family permease